MNKIFLITIMLFSQIALAVDGIETKGSIITSIKKTSIFEKIGLKPGDQVLKINDSLLNSPMINSTDFTQTIQSIAEAQGKVKVSILRNGKKQDLNFSAK